MFMHTLLFFVLDYMIDLLIGLNGMPNCLELCLKIREKYSLYASINIFE